VPFSFRLIARLGYLGRVQPRVGCPQGAWPLENVSNHNDVATESLISTPDTLHALAYERTPINIRIVAFLCLTFCLVVHGAFLSFGVKLQNALGAFKLVVLVLVAGSGFLSLIGVPGFVVGEEYDQPNNYTWRTFWEGSNFGVNAFVIGMYNVIWWVAQCWLRRTSRLIVLGPTSDIQTPTMPCLKSATQLGQSSSRHRWLCAS
jgi:fatty acid desaturase